MKAPLAKGSLEGVQPGEITGLPFTPFLHCGVLCSESLVRCAKQPAAQVRRVSAQPFLHPPDPKAKW